MNAPALPAAERLPASLEDGLLPSTRHGILSAGAALPIAAQARAAPSYPDPNAQAALEGETELWLDLSTDGSTLTIGECDGAECRCQWRLPRRAFGPSATFALV